MRFSVLFIFALIGVALAKPTQFEEARFINTLTNLFNEALKPAITTSAQGIAALLAQSMPIF